MKEGCRSTADITSQFKMKMFLENCVYANGAGSIYHKKISYDPLREIGIMIVILWDSFVLIVRCSSVFSLRKI